MFITSRNFTKASELLLLFADSQDIKQKLQYEVYSAAVMLNAVFTVPETPSEPIVDNTSKQLGEEFVYLQYPCFLEQYMNYAILSPSTPAQAEPTVLELLFKRLKNICVLCNQEQYWRLSYNICIMAWNILVTSMDKPFCKVSISNLALYFGTMSKALLAVLTFVSNGGSIDATLHKYHSSIDDIRVLLTKTIESSYFMGSNELKDAIIWVPHTMDLQLGFVAKFITFSVKALIISNNLNDALELGKAFNTLTNNNFGDMLLPSLIQCCIHGKLDAKELQVLLDNAERDKPKPLVC